MSRPAKFWDRIAERYAKRPIADEAAYERKLEITRKYLRPDMHVLEFGCGTGSTAILHAPHVERIHAIDISAKMLDIAKRRADEAGVGNVNFDQLTLEQLGATEESFDAVLGLSILHLLDDKDAAIAEVHRLLKPGGVFISSTACIGDMAKIFGLILPVGAFLGAIPRVKVFTRTELETSLNDAGFEIDQAWQPGKGKAVFIVAKKAG
ncbi:MAG: class I SAM-dependent methyltransferase [Gammaproteobacteria bacterium]